MKELGEFLGKFSFRIAQHSGMVALTKSSVVKNVSHSPTLLFVSRWCFCVAILFLIGLEFALPLSWFAKAKIAVVQFPYRGAAHMELAVAAARENDYELAEREYKMAWINEKDANSQVLGATWQGAEIEIFPRKSMLQNIAEIEEKLITFPKSRDLLLSLAVKNWQVNISEKSRVLWEEAYKLDPNNARVTSVGKLITK